MSLLSDDPFAEQDMEDWLGLPKTSNGDLEMFPDDWPSNDELSLAMQSSGIDFLDPDSLSHIDDLINGSECHMSSPTVSSDSGNHSPTSSSSEGLSGNDPWQNGFQFTFEDDSRTQQVVDHSYQTYSQEMLVQEDVILDDSSCSSNISHDSRTPTMNSSPLYAQEVYSENTTQVLQQQDMGYSGQAMQNFGFVQAESDITQQIPIAATSAPQIVYIVSDTAKNTTSCTPQSTAIAPAPTPTPSIRLQPYPQLRPIKIKNEIKQEPISNTIVYTTTIPTNSTMTVPLIVTKNGGCAQMIQTVPMIKEGCQNTAVFSGQAVQVNGGGPTRNTPLVRKNSYEVDDFTRKQEDRKLRNRAAAQLSRLRKKTELEDLRQKADQAERECQKLREENTSLKKRIEQLENENQFLRSHTNFPSSKVKNTAKAAGACLLVMALMVSFPSDSIFSKFSPTTHTELAISQPVPSLTYAKMSPVETKSGKNRQNPPHGRSLVADDELEIRKRRSIPDGLNFTASGHNFTNFSSNAYTNSSNNARCPYAIKFLNTTERIKLNNDLISWIDRHEQMNFVKLRYGKNPYLIYNSQNLWYPEMNGGNEPKTGTPSSKSSEKSKRRSSVAKKEAARKQAIRDRAWRHLDMISSGGSDIEKQKQAEYQLKMAQFSLYPGLKAPFEGSQKEETRKIEAPEAKTTESGLLVPSAEAHKQMMTLISTLKQKEDMLYVVAMKDYFLLPTIERNNTAPPKISIILPALSANSSLPNQITMMRIECEVVGTGIFYLPDALVSLFNQSST